MKESEARRPARALAKRLSEIGREVKDLAKNANLRASVALGVALLVLVAVDGFNWTDCAKLKLFDWICALKYCLPWAVAGMIPLWLLGHRSYLVYAILSPLRRLWFCGLRLRDRILFSQLCVECKESLHHLLHD